MNSTGTFFIRIAEVGSKAPKFFNGKCTGRTQVSFQFRTVVEGILPGSRNRPLSVIMWWVLIECLRFMNWTDKKAMRKDLREFKQAVQELKLEWIEKEEKSRA